MGLAYHENDGPRPGAYQPSSGGFFDAFVARLDLDASLDPAQQLLYLSYLGGSANEAIQAAGLDPSGDLWITGFTWSTNYPVTQNAYDRSFGGEDDVYLTRLRLDGSLEAADQLVYSTFLGAESFDYAIDLRLGDPAGTVTLFGTTCSARFPTTEGACDASLAGGCDAFFATLDPAAGAGGLLHSTLLGGNGWEDGYAVSRDKSGSWIVAGATWSSDLAGVEDGLQPDFGGNVDAVVYSLGSMGFPKAVAGPFLRGDCTGDGSVDIADAVCTLNWLFGGEATPGCPAALNTNGDDEVNLTDPVSLLSFLFGGGPAPVEPFPECGPDTLPPDQQLGCANPPNCR